MQRPQIQTVIKRLNEQRKFIQMIEGPRTDFAVHLD